MDISRSGRERGGILRILLIILGALFVIVIGIGIYIAMNWKGWTADFANMAVAEMIKETGLPQDQQNTILAEVDRLGDDFRNGRIGVEEIGRVAKAVGESPLIPLAGVQVARTKYIDNSDMTLQEKDKAVLALQRFARGVHEKKIPKEAVEDAIKPVSTRRDHGGWDLKNDPTRMEIDQFIANVKAQADMAGIPEEPFDLNIAEELKKAIRSAAVQQ